MKSTPSHTPVALVLGQRYIAANGKRVILTQRVTKQGKFKYLGRCHENGIAVNVPAKWMGGCGGSEATGQNGWDLVKLYPWPRCIKDNYGHFSNIKEMRNIAKMLHGQGVKQTDIANVLGAGTGTMNAWLKVKEEA